MNPDWGIGQFLAFQRKQYGIASQAEFADRIGVSRFQLARIESGQTPLSMLIAWKACRELNLHPGFLVSRGSNLCGDFAALDGDAVLKANALIAAMPNARFIDLWPALYSSLFESSEHAEKNNLQNGSLSSNLQSEQSEIQKLIARVKLKAAKPGGKAELARALCVAPARITEWLNGDKEPSGNYALRLLQWVEHPEPNQT